ncbi:DUF1876 family protein [Micromonospora sp. WMMD1102]|uniref:dsRBD fold-containing protein n=1 Tax=Micromonospora sp. WMMD1102 TaxID=3016105 RepID=UPI0024152F95|nr:dsRBD fold-containing protein [Micromonospora sp. WMMD1102]MDG4786691.1 DUF1876 family protein [Micromonospora sp. WMMD1102]
MSAVKRWNVEILVGAADGRTYAEAQLYDEIRDDLVGAGQARLRPDGSTPGLVGEEVAVARALSDLGHRLLVAASGDLEEAVHTPVTLEH